MNQCADWDVIWRWQWFRRPLWDPFFADATHPEGRPARTTPIWSWMLRQAEASRVLDCNAGLGTRAILLKESGFDVVGTDSSGVAAAHAAELARARSHELPFHHVQWQNLGEQFGPEFDAIVNDAFAWTLDRTELRFAAHNFASVLKPGGILIFTGADQWSTGVDKETLLDHAWHAAPRFQLRNDYERDETHLTLVVTRDKGAAGIVENYLFVVRDDNGPRLETAAICNSVQWSWEDYQAICREAGFTSVESVKVPIGRREHVLNIARK